MIPRVSNKKKHIAPKQRQENLKKYLLLSVVILICISLAIYLVYSFRAKREDDVFQRLATDIEATQKSFQQIDSGWGYEKSCKPIAMYGTIYHCDTAIFIPTTTLKKEKLQLYIDALNKKGVFVASIKNESLGSFAAEVVWKNDSNILCGMYVIQEFSKENTLTLSCGGEASRQYYERRR